MLTVMTLLGLDFGGVIYPWGSTKVICLLVFGLVSGGLFVYSQAKLAKYPLIPLRAFKDKSICAAMLVVTLHGFVYIAAPYFLPLYFQAVLDASPLMSGIFLLPFAVSECIAAVCAAIYISKTGKSMLSVSNLYLAS